MTKDKKEERISKLKGIVQSMPEKPGSYQFYDENNVIIYVGKAKRLKSRVSSYFHKEVDRFKTKVLVSKIHNISYTVVNTEEDALLLENSLIKKYTPRYNVLLKDGKTYPSICVTHEYFPRIFKTRTINHKTGSYFGPFTNVTALKSLLELITKIYKPRSCQLPLTPQGIANNKFKSCLEYHIHNCLGPCIGKQTMEDYNEKITQAREILKGNVRKTSVALYEKMMLLAQEMRFEEAQELKKQYELIASFVAKSEVVSHTIRNVDVFSITHHDNEKTAFINYIHVKNGTINQSFTYEYKQKVNETNEELLVSAILEIRNRFASEAQEIIVPFEIDWQLTNAYFTVPQRGDKKKLLELSEMNGKQYKFDRMKQADKLNPEQKYTRIMKELQNHLQLSKLPYHIECFDNSNISGTNAVAGCVVFKGMKPSKSDYRKYNIKTVVGPDDYASMQEVVYRRYKRMIDEGKPLPDLIITDGGKGQMSVVREVIEGQLHLHNSELFLALMRIQDEVHRYAISFHRDKRSKTALHSELDNIKGVGAKTKEALISQFKSVKKIKSANLEQLTEVLGASKAATVFNYFHQEEQNSDN